ncbi:MAG: glycosyltransferase [Pseudomonadota bacterium]
MKGVILLNSVVLQKEIQEKINEIQEAEIIIGIPSYNNARTIGHVVRAVNAGLSKYFPDKKGVVVNSDGGSTDGTMEIFQNTTIGDYQAIHLHHPVETFFKITTPYHGIPGKGSAFRTIFEIADALHAKACAVVDSDLRSITPEWIELLIKPVLEDGLDYVLPLYHRHKYDGTITNSIIYPITRALYGKRVRQPIGGDFGFSGELARFYLSKDIWESDVARYGIDIWMTTTALANNFKVCQAFLGAKIHDAKDPGADLSAMLNQVLGSTFDLMEEYANVWKTVKGSESVPNFGFEYTVGLEPISVNIDRMIDRFRLGVKELMTIWKGFLSRDITDYFGKAVELPRDRFHIPDEIWVEIIYSFALVAHKKIINREHLLRSLTPLYIGRTASFVLEAWESNAEEVERKIEKLCKIYEEKRYFLIVNWR